MHRGRGQGLARHRHDRNGRELNYSRAYGDSSRLASEQMALLQSIGDPTLTMGLTFETFCTGSVRASSARLLAVVADRHRPGRW